MYSYGPPTHGRAKAGLPARTYIQQLCEDTGCCPEDLPEAMNDWEKWRERVRDIRATSTTWWYIYIYIEREREREKEGERERERERALNTSKSECRTIQYSNYMLIKSQIPQRVNANSHSCVNSTFAQSASIIRHSYTPKWGR